MRVEYCLVYLLFMLLSFDLYSFFFFFWFSGS